MMSDKTIRELGAELPLPPEERLRGLPAPLLTRFAPSPTGFLHLGHALHLLYVWTIARKARGRVLLRMEDHDRMRCRPEYEGAILEDLEWLGLYPDFGTFEEFRAGSTPFRQSDCDVHYAGALERMKARGLVYGCDCSRKQIKERTGDAGEELRYDNHCRERGLPPEAPYGIRVAMADEAIAFEDLFLGPQFQNPAAQCGDMLVRDRHGCWTYQYCVAVDDLRQGVNLVIRGQDILASTGRQIQLMRLLDASAGVPMYGHHPLIADPAGNKLSKRDFAKSLRELRMEGMTADAIMRMAVDCMRGNEH